MANGVSNNSSHHASALVGWREWVGLPDLGVEWLKAKIDTGAQTSSLHAFGVEEFSRDGVPWVRFEIHPLQRSARDAVVVELPVHDQRSVRSSNGGVQVRYVVLLRIRLLDRVVEAEVTLSRRDSMGYRMLVGRELLAQGFLVDSASSYVGGKPKRRIREAHKAP